MEIRMSIRVRRLSFLEYPNYKVSTEGRVWSNWSKRGKTGPWKEMRLRENHGRLYVSLFNGEKPGVGKRYFVHHLVLLAFVGPRPPRMECRHFPDPDPTNNRLENVHWGTKEQNEADKLVHGTSNRGSRNPAAKFTEKIVRQIRRAYRSGNFTQGELAGIFNTVQNAISQIVNYKSWKHVA